MLALVVCLVVVFAVAGLGSLGMGDALREWYPALRKPAWTPPRRLFGPAWTTLYLMMAVAAWLVWWRGGREGRRRPLELFGLQLVLNGLWTPIFFGLHSIAGGMVVIAMLWCAILATMVAFWSRVPLAGALLVPYQLWVTYAAALNAAIWHLNA
ncbi:MAG: TspO/MBR family protein [Candidatus Brocadiia bacterium]